MTSRTWLTVYLELSWTFKISRPVKRQPRYKGTKLPKASNEADKRVTHPGVRAEVGSGRVEALQDHRAADQMEVGHAGEIHDPGIFSLRHQSRREQGTRPANGGAAFIGG